MYLFHILNIMFNIGVPCRNLYVNINCRFILNLLQFCILFIGHDVIYTCCCRHKNSVSVFSDSLTLLHWLFRIVAQVWGCVQPRWNKAEGKRPQLWLSDHPPSVKRCKSPKPASSDRDLKDKTKQTNHGKNNNNSHWLKWVKSLTGVGGGWGVLSRQLVSLIIVSVISVTGLMQRPHKSTLEITRFCPLLVCCLIGRISAIRKPYKPAVLACGARLGR